MSSAAPSIRIARPADVPALTELMRFTFSDTFRHYPPEELARYLEEHYGEEDTRRLLGHPHRRTWVAEAGGALIAYAVAGEADLPHPSVDARSGQLHRLYVHPAHHHAGLGRRLMELALGWLEEQGRSPIFIGVWEGNARARAFYARYGFHPVGEYPYPVGSTVDRELILTR